tara:strand:- start:43956 stop:44336 length:381 start_codon:yes stop_codon:yes gene_type:complete
MSKKNQLVLAVMPFASAHFQDVFANVEESEIDGVKEDFSAFLEDVFTLNNHENEDIANSIGHLYDAYRRRFPIGSKEGELVLLQLLGAFAREVDAKQQAIMQDPLAMLMSMLEGEDSEVEASVEIS